MGTSPDRRIAQFIAELDRTISRERIATYRRPGESDLDMLTTYFWNLALSESLYSTIAIFEVAFRNSIHLALESAYGNSMWFDIPNLLERRERDTVNGVRQDLIQHRKQITDGRIVAGLSFVFWEWMFNRPYESKIWHANQLAILRSAFPNLPTSFRSRAAVENRCREVRKLRNRIAHQEPIWNRPDLANEHLNVLRGIRWISRQTEAIAVVVDRFPDVHRYGRVRINAELKRMIGI